ncbi:hypothetical protein KR084_003436, partial [Drosophila pseudotakahashii]
CKQRVRWYSKGKSYLPPKELYDKAMKALEARKLTISARLKPDKAKKSETAVLEIFCRALASANKSGDGGKSKESKEVLVSSSKGEDPTVSSSQKVKKKLDCINLIVNQDFQPQSKSSSVQPQQKLETLQIFNCKHCNEKSSVNTQGFPEMLIVNCKDCHGDGNLQSSESIMGTAIPTQQGNRAIEPISVIEELSKYPSHPKASEIRSSKQDTKAVAPGKPQESLPPLAERFAMPQKLAFPVGRNPCIDGSRAEKAKCPKPKPKPCSSAQEDPKPPVKATSPVKTAPQGNSSTKTNALPKTNAVDKPKAPVSSTPQVKPNKTQSEKKPSTPGVGFALPENSAFPSGRNPCKDGKKDGKKSKCAASKLETKKPKVDMSMEKQKPKAPVKNQCKLEKKEETCTKESPVRKEATVSSSSPKPKPEEPAKPAAEKSSRQGVVNSKQPQVKPTSSPVKANAPPKPKPKPKLQSTDGKLPPLPSSSFSMPLLSAFPMGRNPCRDGPRGGSANGCSKPKDNPCSNPKVKPCKSETDSCTSEKKNSGVAGCLTKTSLDKKASASISSAPQKDAKPHNSIKSGESLPAPKALPPPAAKEIKESTGGSPAKAPLPPPPAKEIKESMGPPQPPSKKEIESSPDKKEKSCKRPLSKPQSAKESDRCKVKCDSELGKSPKVSETSDPNRKPELKRFPALPLKQSLASYISSIEPLLTEEELKEEQKITKQFRENEGADLQELLEEEAEKCSNWLTPRWTRSAYLSYQAPLTVFSSPGLSFPVQEFTEPLDFLNFTAKAIYAICKFKKLVYQNQIPVVKMGKNLLDNSQFCKIFGTIRKPGRFCDTIEQFSDSDYVVVVYNNNYYKLPIYSESGKLLHVHSLRDALEKILNCPVEKGEPFGLLTHDNRSNWAEAYTALCCPHGNADSVETIEQSLFLVCLDQCVPVPKGKERIVQAHQLLHGGGLRQNSANRWMDKTIQLIVNPNGLAGFCYEHSPADCQPLAMLMDFVQQKVNEENYGCDDCKSDKDISFRLLQFQPVNECINLWLCQARRNIQRISSQLLMNVFQFECHGKCFIKAQGLNPDSYIQMALSLAYYSLHRRIPAQYESAHLRIFCEGRTETIRSTSNESKSFVLAMQSKATSSHEKLVALQKAVDAHEKLIKEAINGQGIDRHLFGLQQMALENGLPVPEFFTSTGFVRSVTFQLFTSQVATSHEGFMAYGPLISDGYGVCYNPQEEKIIFAISSWKTCPEISPTKYGKAIKSSLNAMRRLILETGGDCVGQNPCKCEKIRF